MSPLYASAISAAAGLGVLVLGRLLDRRNVLLGETSAERMDLLDESRKLRDELRRNLHDCEVEQTRLRAEIEWLRRGGRP